MDDNSSSGGGYGGGSDNGNGDSSGDSSSSNSGGYGGCDGSDDSDAGNEGGYGADSNQNAGESDENNNNGSGNTENEDGADIGNNGGAIGDDETNIGCNINNDADEENSLNLSGLGESIEAAAESGWENIKSETVSMEDLVGRAANITGECSMELSDSIYQAANTGIDNLMTTVGQVVDAASGEVKAITGYFSQLSNQVASPQDNTNQMPNYSENATDSSGGQDQDGEKDTTPADGMTEDDVNSKAQTKGVGDLQKSLTETINETKNGLNQYIEAAGVEESGVKKGENLSADMAAAEGLDKLDIAGEYVTQAEKGIVVGIDKTAINIAADMLTMAVHPVDTLCSIYNAFENLNGTWNKISDSAVGLYNEAASAVNQMQENPYEAGEKWAK